MENNKGQLVALFDFCETLVDFQTADAFVDFVRNHILCQKKNKMFFLESILTTLKKFRIIAIINIIFSHKFSISKRLKLLQLKGLSLKELDAYAEEYYNNIIRPHLIGVVLTELKKLQSDGLKIIIVSGGYDIYLKYFAKEFSIDKLISSRIKFSKGVCNGTLWGIDCLNKNKTKLLNKINTEDRYYYKFAYSDSITDLPMLHIADKAIVVSKHKNQHWAELNKFRQIIW